MECIAATSTHSVIYNILLVNEFRIRIDPGGRLASSPTIHCGPDLTRTPKRNGGRKTMLLRAPTLEMKAVWQNLLQRQM